MFKMPELDEVEKELDSRLERLLAHPLFLQAVGTMLNLNSYRKIWLNRTLTAGWKLLQLPNKRDQERTLHLINELHHRIAELESKLDAAKSAEDEQPASTVKVQLKKKTANGSELVSIQ